MEDQIKPRRTIRLDEVLAKLANTAPVATKADKNNIAEESADFAGRQKQVVLAMENDRVLRTKFAHNLFWYMAGWSAFVGLVILLQGFGYQHFAIGDTVLSILCSTTTVSVIGLMLAILRGLFPTVKRH